MSQERYITVEQMEQATDSLLENGKKVGADSWQQRVKNQTPHCGVGEAGTCCRICSMGPCRITPKAPRGICGCDVHGIVGRNYLRFTAGGAATHSDHGREICHTLYRTREVVVEQAEHALVGIDGRLMHTPVGPFKITVEQEVINFLIPD